ncbi:MAG: hypothetical protein H0V14_07150 [Chitinophagaceae bacterium]|jgi:hypothetical protein|nr:hypothetical protein [Chitinophagaceae bacterium]
MNTERIQQVLMIWNFSSLMSLPSRAHSLQEQEHNIKVTKFTVSRTDKKKIFIDWSAGDSISTNYSEIQKSTNNVNFKTNAMVLCPDTKRSDYHHYGCFDKFVQKIARHSYYTFKHIDNAGLE